MLQAWPALLKSRRLILLWKTSDHKQGNVLFFEAICVDCLPGVSRLLLFSSLRMQ